MRGPLREGGGPAKLDGAMVANGIKRSLPAFMIGALAVLAALAVVGLGRAALANGDSLVTSSSSAGDAPPVREGCEGRFCDEDGSVHQANIETAAEWGITQGCDAERFCPSATISRRQMAAFLYRAVTHQSGEAPAVPEVSLPDVEEDAWYRDFAQWAVSAEVMPVRDDGEFHPGEMVTRGEMAEMLLAAFPLLESRSPSGAFKEDDSRDDLSSDTAFECLDCDDASEIFFADLNEGSGVAQAALVLRDAGVTNGCATTPLRFCPDRPVTREQMASFFVRSLTALPAPSD